MRFAKGRGLSRIWLAILALLAYGCPQKRTAKRPDGPLVPQAGSIDESKLEPGLTFRLSEGSAALVDAGKAERLPTPKTATLSEAETKGILGRLPALVQEADDAKDFALRERSLPPPKTGKTVKDSFPPPEQPDVPVVDQPGPLEVVRFQPEGDVPIAPHVSITFSQPMVPITSIDDLKARPLPVKLSPEPAGEWQWVGAKTLLFKPHESLARMPMATTYTVDVPAGTRSETGGVLAEAKTFTFQTPAPVVQSTYPWDGTPTKLDPVFFVTFDQRIDAAAVLATIKVTARNKTYTARLATPAEVKAEPTVSSLAKQADAQERQGRWLAFVLTEKLPTATYVQVAIGPGTPSAEGPRTTAAEQSFGFSTYGPLDIVEARCGYEECHPQEWWSIQFTNPIDTKLFNKAKMIRVEPALPGMKVEVYGEYLSINGRSKGRTTYKVTFSSSLPDVFGQTLGADKTVTFKVGSAQKALYANGGDFQVLDPEGGGKFTVYSTNHKQLKVKLYAVGPEDWQGFAYYMREWQRDGKRPRLPGKVVLDTTLDIKGEPDDLTETRIDLAPALTDRHGQVIVVVEPTTQPKNRWERQIVQAWVQVTDIGLDAFVDHRDLHAWATNLKNGKPLEGVDLTMVPHGATAKTARDGLATLQLGAPVKQDMHLLLARKGTDLAILPEHTYWWSDQGGWQRHDDRDFFRWYVFDDRGMYRPGEQVHVKGWLRKYGAGKGGDIGGIGGASTKIGWRLVDSRGNEVLKGTADVNAVAGFDFALTLPGTVNLGYTRLELHSAAGKGGLDGNYHTHYIQVQEFRRPEFEVTASASQGPFIVGTGPDATAIVTASAHYYAGGGLPNAEVYWNVSSAPGAFTPPNRDDYTFGSWVPWWPGHGGGGYGDDSASQQYKYKDFAGRTDGRGLHHLRLDFDGIKPPRATTVTAQASVMDVNRQMWAASATVLVHPAAHYVGMKSDRIFVNEGEPLPVDAIVTDLDGALQLGSDITMTSVLLDWTYEDGQYKTVEGKAETCVVKSAQDAVRCTFHPAEGGTYRVRAEIRDPEGRRNESELTLWVAGADKMPPTRGVEQQQVTLIPNKKEYRPEETAEILVQAPFFPAEGIVSYRRSGIVYRERFTMKSSSMTLQVPLSSTYIPNLYVQVDLVGAAPRTNDVGEPQPKLPRRPAYAMGQLNLAVPPLERKLAVTVTPVAAKVEPGAETEVEIEVRDATGRPVAGAELAVVVVDEAILALSGHRLPDPLAVFYSMRGPDASDYHSRQYVVLANPMDLVGSQDNDGDAVTDDFDGAAGTIGHGSGTGSGYGAGGGKGGADRSKAPAKEAGAQPDEAPPSPVVATNGESGEGGQQPAIQLRTNFDALALFAPAVPTDARGRATVKVKVPDNLTRYRVMVASVAGEKQFGAGEATITARLPLMVRPSPPRFLNFGDQFELPVVLQNQTDKPMSVDVAVRATNAQLGDENAPGLGRRVTVPANDRVEVRFPAAAMRAGIARFQIGAVGDGKWSDAAELKLPVWTPATTEAFATYGQIDGKAGKSAIIQPVKAPPNVWPQFGGLEITTTSTAVAELTDAVLYLVSYPFECSEQLSSRVMAVAALKDVLAAFSAAGLPSDKELLAAVTRDLERLKQMQNYDGGFAFWRAGDESWPYLSVHVAHALVRAKEKGFTVEQYMLERSKVYLQNVESYIPYWYPNEVRWTIIAYALYVRDLMGDPDVARAKQLITQDAGGADKLPLEADGWLLSMLSGKQNVTDELQAIRKHLANRVEETAAMAHFTTGYADGAYLLLASDRRADGIILEALIKDQPKSDLIPKIVKDLLGHRVAGRWANTQENVFVLISLDKYFHTYENVTPDFVARTWLGVEFAGEHEFKGRTTEKHHVDVPMQWLVDAEAKGKQGAAQNLILQKDGGGRLYYRIGMSYAPTDLKMAPSDHGFVVQRKYEAIDDPSDVKRDADGTWRVKAGAKVRVRLTMVAQTRRYHVALVDPVPAGLEPMNSALAVTGAIPKDPQDQQRGGAYWYWNYNWWEHENLRDERVEAFTTLLWEGVWDYDYVARATTPGIFVVPPTKAEEMYHPETFGRSGSDRLIVE